MPRRVLTLQIIDLEIDLEKIRVTYEVVNKLDNNLFIVKPKTSGIKIIQDSFAKFNNVTLTVVFGTFPR